MPSYTYRCLDKDCQHVFALTHSVKDMAIVLCPLCEERTERILTEAPAVLSPKNNALQATQDSAAAADTTASEEVASQSAAGSGCVLHRHDAESGCKHQHP